MKYKRFSFARQNIITYADFLIGFLVAIHHYVPKRTLRFVFKCLDNPSPIFRANLASKVGNLILVPRIFKDL